jgi:hypothetical protein
MELGEEYAADRSVSKCLCSYMCYKAENQARVKGAGGLYSPDIRNKGIWGARGFVTKTYSLDIRQWSQQTNSIIKKKSVMFSL